MDLTQVIEEARDAITVKRVYGDPIAVDGVTVIPAADVRGGAGGGEGTDEEHHNHGAGGGFGVVAKPAGAFVIHDGEVTWRPAVDVNRIVLGVTGVVAGLAIRRALRKRSDGAGDRAAKRRQRRH